MAGVDEEAPMSKAEIDAWLAAQTGAIDGRAQELLDGAGVTAPPPLPVAGEMEWGRWSQRGAALSFELRVPEATRAADVRCECLIGFLDVRVRDEPLLSGRLAAAEEVRPTELEWLLDTTAEGERLLCVELPRRAPPPEQGRPPPTPIFRSLRVAGVEVAEPGLVEEAAARQSRA